MSSGFPNREAAASLYDPAPFHHFVSTLPLVPNCNVNFAKLR